MRLLTKKINDSSLNCIIFSLELGFLALILIWHAIVAAFVKKVLPSLAFRLEIAVLDCRIIHAVFA